MFYTSKFISALALVGLLTSAAPALAADCPQRALGLYCPDDPSPETNPNLNSSSNGDGGEEEQPALPVKKGLVKGIATKYAKGTITITNRHVPAVVERLFGDVFGRKITHPESLYWKKRARSDKRTEVSLKGALEWHKLHNRSVGK